MDIGTSFEAHWVGAVVGVSIEPSVWSIPPEQQAVVLAGTLAASADGLPCSAAVYLFTGMSECSTVTVWRPEVHSEIAGAEMLRRRRLLVIALVCA